MPKLHCRGGVTPPLLFIIASIFLAACQHDASPKDPVAVADAFVRAYYIDTDLQGALAYCDGLACQTLRDEMKLREGQKITADTQRPDITAKRTKEPEEKDGVIWFVYKVRVKAPGIEPFERQAYIKLRQGDQAWKVTQFAELKP